MIRFN